VLQRGRNLLLSVMTRYERFLVRRGYPAFLLLVDMPYRIKRSPLVLVFPDAKHQRGADIVGRGRQVDDEASREEIASKIICGGGIVYEDVRERSGRVGHIRLARERCEQL